jgi:hypothetical protein
MSLSNPKAENPVTKWIEFKGSTGKFQYWDKATESNIELPLNKIGFIVLDELNTISGYHSSAEAGIYSNEISDLSHETLTVKVFKTNIQITGLYKDIKDNIKAIGGKFTKSVYAALITGKDSLELVNFKMSGSGFGGWLDKHINLLKQGVKVTGLKDGEKGATKFKIPIFEGFEMPENLRLKAVDMDKELQEYLKQYKSKQIETAEVVNEVQDVIDNIPHAAIEVDDIIPTDNSDDLPF